MIIVKLISPSCIVHRQELSSVSRTIRARITIYIQTCKRVYKHVKHINKSLSVPVTILLLIDLILGSGRLLRQSSRAYSAIVEHSRWESTVPGQLHRREFRGGTYSALPSVLGRRSVRILEDSLPCASYDQRKESAPAPSSRSRAAHIFLYNTYNLDNRE